LIPSAAEKILVSLGVNSEELVLSEISQWGNLEVGKQIKKGDPVFPRLEKK